MYAYLKSASPDEEPFVEGFLNEVDAIRTTGLATSHGYIRSELSGVATPVIERGTAVAAIGLIGFRDEMEDRLDSLGQTLRTRVLDWSRRTFDDRFT
ncbi:hypothetical protein [Leekyejoonella antrihumi]|uniref:IclR-ED domain-containing protein n=1 Tax=Leekyejoonella antrihumi TaxID=1660198 RepID=A0A563DWT3_9MICO|nr:hypothetical protein [Leekyejoonella antrihumi]TWP34589.1 hypothetical protein FGL98_16980 [Leekyejoonella antrihumi]